jgi:hypothetical protein
VNRLSLFDNPNPCLTARDAVRLVEMRVSGFTPTDRHDTIRRRAQELEENHGLLEIVADTGRATVYRLTPDGERALEGLRRGERVLVEWEPETLARLLDRNPSQSAVRHLKPESDFANLLRVYGGDW